MQVLFTHKKSHYPAIVGAERCWGEDRDALNYCGDEVLIAHPPCRLWGQLYRCSTAPACEKGLAIWALQMVERNGGAVEHPKNSRLFKESARWLRRGFFVELNQFDFGHKALKPTVLYITGINKNQLPALPEKRSDSPKFVCCWSRPSRSEKRPALSKVERQLTPPRFAEWLVNLARVIEEQK